MQSAGRAVRPVTITLVPHTHWDREWYEPFQVFRHRLVAALDSVLELIEAEPGFRFTLDGQTAAIEDYLEIRPENTARVAAAVRGGQLAIGPWQILLDEFLCSGETIIRNLRMGWAGAERLGRAMPVGYLPDMFGHIAQMPQILVRSGLSHAALWRGVPSSVTGHGFRWQAPDGSQVRVEYLFDGYGNALDLLLVRGNVPRSVREYLDATRERWAGDPILGMTGTDHMPPRRDIMRLADELSAAGLGVDVSTLDEYIRALPDSAQATVVRGELRSHARANVLPGVISVRRGLKVAMAETERTLDEAERLAVAAGLPSASTAPFLQLAWRKTVESSAHDSVVGSGTDETVEQVAARLAEAAHLARAVRDAAMERIAAVAPAGSLVVANPLTRARTIVIEAQVEAGEAAQPDGLFRAESANGGPVVIQAGPPGPTVLGDETMGAAEVERVLRRIHRQELFGLLVDRYEVAPGVLTFHLARVPGPAEFDLLRLRAELAAAVRRSPGTWRVRTLARPARSLALAVAVPASGHAVVRLEPAGQSTGAAGGLRTGPRSMANSTVGVDIAADGTLTVTAADGTVVAGVGSLADGGDRGDSYNYGPPARDRLVRTPHSVDLRWVEDGPVRSVAEIVRDYFVPAALADDPDGRSAETVLVATRMRVELRAHEPFVRVGLAFTNTASDHRLRFHVPTMRAADRSHAEGQFAVTARAARAEGGWGEYPLPTFPASAFVSAGAVTVLLKHVTEYELVEGGGELALTVLRAVGAMSVNVHPMRDEPAAQQIPVPGAQELGTHVTAEFGILPSPAGWRAASAVRWAEDFRSPGLVADGRSTATAGGSADTAAAEGIAVDGADIAVSAVHRVGDAVEIRLTAMCDEGATAVVRGDFTTVETVDLLGRSEKSTLAAGAIEVALGAWEIRTLRLS
jgi:mannosylglycerate hydrolase